MPRLHCLHYLQTIEATRNGWILHLRRRATHSRAAIVSDSLRRDPGVEVDADIHLSIELPIAGCRLPAAGYRARVWSASEAETLACGPGRGLVRCEALQYCNTHYV